MLFPILFFAIGYQADAKLPPKKLDLKPHWDPAHEVMMNQDVQVQESIVDINGTKYRKLVYEGRVFFLEMRGSENSGDADDAICATPLRDRLNAKMVETGINITRRTHLFVEAITKKCHSTENRAVYSPDLNVGVKFKGKSGYDDDKKVFVNPLTRGVGAQYKY